MAGQGLNILAGLAGATRGARQSQEISISERIRKAAASEDEARSLRMLAAQGDMNTRQALMSLLGSNPRVANDPGINLNSGDPQADFLAALRGAGAYKQETVTEEQRRQESAEEEAVRDREARQAQHADALQLSILQNTQAFMGRMISEGASPKDAADWGSHNMQVQLEALRSQGSPEGRRRIPGWQGSRTPGEGAIPTTGSPVGGDPLEPGSEGAVQGNVEGIRSIAEIVTSVVRNNKNEEEERDVLIAFAAGIYTLEDFTNYHGYTPETVDFEARGEHERARIQGIKAAKEGEATFDWIKRQRVAGYFTNPNGSMDIDAVLGAYSDASDEDLIALGEIQPDVDRDYGGFSTGELATFLSMAQEQVDRVKIPSEILEPTDPVTGEPRPEWALDARGQMLYRARVIAFEIDFKKATLTAQRNGGILIDEPRTTSLIAGLIGATYDELESSRDEITRNPKYYWVQGIDTERLLRAIKDKIELMELSPGPELPPVSPTAESPSWLSTPLSALSKIFESAKGEFIGSEAWEEKYPEIAASRARRRSR